MDDSLFVSGPDDVTPLPPELTRAKVDAVGMLAAQVTNNTDVLTVLLEDTWAKGCTIRMYTITTWLGVAEGAAEAAGVAPAVVIGDSQGTPKKPEEMSASDLIMERMANLFFSDDQALLREALSEAHDFLHEAEESEARGLFVSMLALAASITKTCMDYLASGGLPQAPDEQTVDGVLQRIFATEG